MNELDVPPATDVQLTTIVDWGINKIITQPTGSVMTVWPLLLVVAVVLLARAHKGKVPPPSGPQ